MNETRENKGHGNEAPQADAAPTVVVFDIGEVLIDESRVWRIWAELVGVSELTFGAVLGAAISQGLDIADAFEHVAPNVDWREFEDEHERRYGGFVEDDLYADARPCLTDLRAAGVVTVLAGNQPERRAQQLRALNLPVSQIVTSAELGHEKPDSSFFAALRTFLTDAGIEVDDPAQLLYVGDRVDNDVIPAADAGMRTCWIRRGPWGQLQDNDAIEPDLLLEGLGELPTLLADWETSEA